LIVSNRDELRRRFIKAESTLFRVRYNTDDPIEREEFLNSRDFGWQQGSGYPNVGFKLNLLPQVSTAEKTQYAKELQAALPPSRIPMHAVEMEFRKVIRRFVLIAILRSLKYHRCIGHGCPISLKRGGCS
jgi:hypothetical protein